MNREHLILAGLGFIFEVDEKLRRVYCPAMQSECTYFNNGNLALWIIGQIEEDDAISVKLQKKIPEKVLAVSIGVIYPRL